MSMTMEDDIKGWTSKGNAATGHGCIAFLFLTSEKNQGITHERI